MIRNLIKLLIVSQLFFGNNTIMKKILLTLLTVALLVLTAIKMFPEIERTLHHFLGWY